MKKMLILLVASLIVSGCTEQERTRKLGGDMTIELPKGQRLIMATWKGNDLFTLTEPMDSEYIPKTKTFKESSSWGVLESTITFVETK